MYDPEAQRPGKLLTVPKRVKRDKKCQAQDKICLIPQRWP
jgi:hypothetical protein